MINALIGGGLIGLSATLMLLLNGRIAGISGMTGGAIGWGQSDRSWRVSFLLGLLIGGYFFYQASPDSFQVLSNARLFDYAFAGVLVGFGSRLGSGCTSGHGVCDISRLSPRSIAATLIFMGSAIVSVVVFKMLRGEI